MKILGLTNIEVNDEDLDEHMEMLENMVWNPETETYEKTEEISLIPNTFGSMANSDSSSSLELLTEEDDDDVRSRRSSFSSDGYVSSGYGSDKERHIPDTSAWHARNAAIDDANERHNMRRNLSQAEANQRWHNHDDGIFSDSEDQRAYDDDTNEAYAQMEEEEEEKKKLAAKKTAAKKTANVDELAGSLSTMTVSASKKADKFTTRRLKDGNTDIKGKNDKWLRYKQNKRTGELSKVNPKNYTTEGDKVFKSIKEKNSKKGGRKSRRKRKKKTRKKKGGKKKKSRRKRKKKRKTRR